MDFMVEILSFHERNEQVTIRGRDLRYDPGILCELFGIYVPCLSLHYVVSQNKFICDFLS